MSKNCRKAYLCEKKAYEKVTSNFKKISIEEILHMQDLLSEIIHACFEAIYNFELFGSKKALH